MVKKIKSVKDKIERATNLKNLSRSIISTNDPILNLISVPLYYKIKIELYNFNLCDIFYLLLLSIECSMLDFTLEK